VRFDFEIFPSLYYVKLHTVMTLLVQCSMADACTVPSDVMLLYSLYAKMDRCDLYPAILSSVYIIVRN